MKLRANMKTQEKTNSSGFCRHLHELIKHFRAKRTIRFFLLGL